MDLNGLELQVDGMTRTFAEWTQDFVDSYYPNIGVDCYRVPAQHFNRQKLGKSAGDEVEEFKLLDPPIPCIAAGDLAHTQVLDGLEELSHQLKQLEEGPLFIISSVNYDNYLAKIQKGQPKKKRKKKKGSDAGSTQAAPQAKRMREKLEGGEFPLEGGDSGAGDVEGKQDQGKPLLPPRPADRGGQRGEIDVLLLHERRGLILIEVKATGYPDPTWTPTEEELQSAIAHSVQKAAYQLDSACDVLHYVMPDLSLTPITYVIALPLLRKQQVEQAVSNLSFDPRLRFLYKEDLLPHPSQHPSPPSPTAAAAAAAADTGECHDRHHVPPMSSILSWWRGNVDLGDDEGLELNTLRTIVGRICGLMSVVSVWTNSKPRVEVRTVSQAVGEAGRRVSDIALLPRQADLLAQQDLLRAWLTGPMGSGKTLMLQLKGRQWVREGRRVVVINMRTIARGRPIGHVLEEGIRQGAEGHPGAKSVDRCDVALDEYDIDVLHSKLAERGSMENVCFVVDEVLSDMSVVPEQLARRYPDSPVWCVASYVTPVPYSFTVYKLGAVLRNPPSVQLMLKDLDLNPEHKEVYTTRSAARGLPCDGPPIIFIEHAKHDTGVRHLDCLQCAHELADILETQLGLQLRPPTADCDSVSVPARPEVAPGKPASGPNRKQGSKTVEAVPLSFRDVLILSALPYSTFRHVFDYHWEPHIPDVLKYMMYMGSCRFLAGLRDRGVPMKVVVDNSSKDVAFPPKDEVIVADVMGAHSLERKVVVFLRGGGPLTEEEVSEHLSRYQTVQLQAAASAQHQSGHQPEPQNAECPAEAGGQHFGPGTGQDAMALSRELLLFASLMYEVRDAMYPQLPACLTPTPANAKIIIQTLLGNMIVQETQSVVEGKERREKHHDDGPSQITSTDLRVGAEIRGNLPALRKALQAVAGESAGGSRLDGRVHVLEADSVFLVPDSQDDALGREGEVRRVRRALETLSEDDKDWEMFAASRCLSQYISILP